MSVSNLQHDNCLIVYYIPILYIYLSFHLYIFFTLIRTTMTMLQKKINITVINERKNYNLFIANRLYIILL